MREIEFNIELVTPMFMAGADQKRAELRAASIKGLLRFWWRALEAESNLDALREKEAMIFGSNEMRCGGSSFGIRIITKGNLKPKKDRFPSKSQYQVQVEGKPFKINILEYLAYGTYEREYYSEGTKFDIVLNFTKEAWKDEVLRAFFVLNIFGGVGSRSRNGFGSLNVMNMEKAFKDESFFLGTNPYERESLNKLIKAKDIVSYPSFTKGTKLFKAKKAFPSALDALADVGKIYKRARGSLENRHDFIKRQYIGAPIVVKKETKSFLDRHANPYFIKIDRHAKPYFIKIAKENDKFRAYILYLPSKYCEGLERDGNNKPIDHAKVNAYFKDICSEFNNFLAQEMETIIRGSQ